MAKVGKYFKINHLTLLTQTVSGCIIPIMSETVAILTRVKPEVKTKLKQLADNDERSLSAYVCKALTEFCKHK